MRCRSVAGEGEGVGKENLQRLSLTATTETFKMCQVCARLQTIKYEDNYKCIQHRTKLRKTEPDGWNICKGETGRRDKGTRQSLHS